MRYDSTKKSDVKKRYNGSYFPKFTRQIRQNPVQHALSIESKNFNSEISVLVLYYMPLFFGTNLRNLTLAAPIFMYQLILKIKFSINTEIIQATQYESISRL